MQRCTYSILSILALTVVIESCVSHELTEPTCTTVVSYSGQIHGIVESKCAITGCHNGDNGADINWSDFAKFQQRALSGEVKRRVVEHTMPPAESPGGPLTEEQIETIACWADQGSLQN
jgi:hypothetical protein